MATTINGTTGIDKVQDGTITGSDLASATVTADKLASTLDLTGKTVTLPAGTGGKVLQVVQTTLASGAWSTTSTSDVATGLSASITPTSSTSKILILFTGRIDSTASNLSAMTSIYKNSSVLVADVAGNYTASGGYSATTISAVYLNAPATTASTTYQIYGRVAYGSGTISQTGLWTLTLMEIAA